MFILCRSKKTLFVQITFFFFFFSLLVIRAVQEELEFNFRSFTQEDSNKTITIIGDASFSSKNQGIDLTPDPDINNQSSSKTGRATYFKPLKLWDKETGKVVNFTSHFSFVVRKVAGSDLGEGFAFFLAPNGSNIPPGSEGGRFGLASKSQQQQNPFVAVEFDTYRNNEWERDFPFNHVGIDINSVTSVVNEYWDNNFMYQRTYEAWITYDSGTKNLSVVFTRYNNEDKVLNNSLSYIIDLKTYLPEWVTFGFSAATSDVFEQNTIRSWEFKVTTVQEENTKSKIGLVVGVSVGSVVLVGALALVGLAVWKKTRRNKKQPEAELGPSMDVEFAEGTGPKKFSYGELARATNNFAEKEKLGEGGFGGVYRGFLRGKNECVAVKRISRGSKQGQKEYASEVKIISQLRHRNMVRLIGWCHEKGELLLVYEFMANGSLDMHLYKEKTLLTWELRYKIAKGLASALLYLHEEWEQCVLHRDIKSSNLMLDADFNAKLGDFGLARLVNHEQDSPSTDLAGTLGYMPIDYVITQKASKESDVYSFGIVALEIACGRKPRHFRTEFGEQSLVEWVWTLYGLERILEAADSKLLGNFEESEMKRLLVVGLWCAHPDFNSRPSIRQASLAIHFESPLPILPENMPPLPAHFGSMTDLPLNTSSFSGTTASQLSQIPSSSYSGTHISSDSSASSATTLLHQHLYRTL